MAKRDDDTGSNPPSDAGGDEGINTLVALYRTPLLSYFLRRVGDRAEAEDLTQQVFFKFISREHNVPAEKVEAFLFTIAVNLLRDRWRSQKSRDIWVKGEDGNDWDAQDEKLAPERILQSRESLQSAVTALGTLTDKTRNIFLLLRLENKSYQEIADLYGISKSGVEKHVAKALARLARYMEP